MLAARNLIAIPHSKPRPAVSVALFLLGVGVMGYLRLAVFGDRFITVTYALPLLVCLWYSSARLLWSMTAAFIAMAGYKAFAFLPQDEAVVGGAVGHWAMQVANILVVATTVHCVMVVLARLRASNAELDRSNSELMARDEEISRQNEELHAQTEELAQQNEEIQQQAEELQAQAEQLQIANTELGNRQQMLETLLLSLRDLRGPDSSPTELCALLLQLVRGAGIAATLVHREAGDVVVQAQAGAQLEATRWDFAPSFAALVMEQERVAGIADLTLRPDVAVARPVGGAFRSVLAAPLHVAGRPAGAIEVYSDQPHAWTREQFQILEWTAAQCSLVLEVRRLQQQLATTNAGLDQLVQKRTVELQELVHELEHFSYTITHDLRAPLRAMQGFAQLLEEESAPRLDEESRGYLHRIRIAAGRMDRLISDALNYSKAVRLELELAPTDPVGLLRGMIESYPALQPPTARIEVPERLPMVLANEAALTQCFSNFLENAVKFVPAERRPHVRVRADERDGTVRLWVEDNGIGIPSEMHERVFMMFQRLSKQYDGTGIGLALVRKVAERMGGRVGVESEPGRGSRFWLELKRAP